MKTILLSFLLFAVFCSAFSAAIDDGQEETKDLGEKSAVCWLPGSLADQKCNSRCLKLGFKSGKCVDMECKCFDDTTEPTDPEEEGPADLGEKSAVCWLPGSLADQKCNSRCLKLGFKSGKCVDMECKCFDDTTEPTDPEEEGPADLGEKSAVCWLPGSLADQKCNSRCLKLGFKSGKCVDMECKCFDDTTEPTDPEEEGPADLGEKSAVCWLPGSLADQKCNSRCLKLGFKSGKCVDMECKCFDDTTEPTDPEEEEPADLGEKSAVCYLPGPLADHKCNNRCVKLGFESGKCVGLECKCFPEKSALQVKEEPKDLGEKSAVCYLPGPLADHKCNNRCVKLGFESGKCVGLECKCFPEKSALQVEEEPKDLDEKSAVCWLPGTLADQKCNSRCLKLGFKSGKCVDMECKCFPEKSALSVEEEPKDLGEKSAVCYLPGPLADHKCNNRCVKLGFESGKCVGLECKCFPEKSTLQEEEPKDLGEKSAVCWLPGTLADQKCNSRCLKLGFKSGKCVDMECKCFPEKSALSVEEEPKDLDEKSAVCYLPGPLADHKCNNRCVKLGFESGKCVGLECKCFPEKSTLQVEKEPKDLGEKSAVCYLPGPLADHKCNNRCVKLGFESGKCVGLECKCFPEKSTLQIEEEPKDLGEKSAVCYLPGPLADHKCNNRCVKLGFESGKCVGLECKCFPEKSFNDKIVKQSVVDEKPEEPKDLGEKSAVCLLPGPLADHKCNNRCVKLGFKSGRCEKMECKCFD